MFVRAGPCPWFKEGNDWCLSCPTDPETRAPIAGDALEVSLWKPRWRQDANRAVACCLACWDHWIFGQWNVLFCYHYLHDFQFFLRKIPQFFNYFYDFPGDSGEEPKRHQLQDLANRVVREGLNEGKEKVLEPVVI